VNRTCLVRVKKLYQSTRYQAWSSKEKTNFNNFFATVFFLILCTEKNWVSVELGWIGHYNYRLQRETFNQFALEDLCVLTYRCLHGLGPDYLSSDFVSVSDLRSRQKLRSASTAASVVPVTRHSTLGDRAFSVIAAKLWNALPGDITSATSLLTFRHKLKTFLFRRSYGE